SQRRGVRPRKDPAPAGDTVGQEPFEGFGPLAPGSREQDEADGGFSGGLPAGATVVHLPTIRPPQGPVAVDASEDGHAEPGRPETEPSGAAGTEDDAPSASDADGAASAARAPAAREARKGKNRSRAKVPSWDEIVFGARPE
ncbi:hypothetical protein G8C93_13035, partial [Cellulosimicrobium cellulans]|nr:hypothetical protein [Cellulosimicrobium cellulans]